MNGDDVALWWPDWRRERRRAGELILRYDADHANLSQEEYAEMIGLVRKAYLKCVENDRTLAAAMFRKTLQLLGDEM